MVTVTIGGENRSPLINSLEITTSLGQQSQCVMRFMDKGQTLIDGTYVGGGWRPEVGEAVEVYDGAYLLYAGSVDDVQTREVGRDVWEMSVRCIDHSLIPSRRLSGEYTWSNISDVQIVLDLCNRSLTAENVGTTYLVDDSPVTTIESFATNYESVADALNSLAEATGKVWRITPGKEMLYHSRTAYPAPFNVTSDPDDALVQNLNIKATREQYANRVVVRIGQAIEDGRVDVFDSTGRTSDDSPAVTDAEMALNGGRKSFDTTYRIYEAPTITINGVARSVGILGVDVATFYWEQGSKRLEMDDGATAPLATDVMVVTYTALIEKIIAVQDGASITERAGVEGNSGYYEVYRKLDDPTTEAAATAYAQALVDRYSDLSYVATYETNTRLQPLAAGLEVGQHQTIARSGFAADGSYLIRSLTVRDMKTSSELELTYSVEAVSGPLVDDSYTFFKKLIGDSGGGVVTLPTATRAPYHVTFGLYGNLSTSPTYAWPCRLNLGSSIVQWHEAQATMTTAPVGADAQIDIEYSADGSTWASIFPAGGTNKIVVADGATTGSQSTLSSALPAMSNGYYLRPVPVQVGSTAPGANVQIVLRGSIA
jgi:hypothetical protein